MPEIKQDKRGDTFIVGPAGHFHAKDTDYPLSGVEAFDTLMLQAAIDNANGGVVKVLSEGVYISNLDVDNCTLVGEGVTEVVGTMIGTILHISGGIHVGPGGRIWDLGIEVAAAYAGTALTVGGDEEIFASIPKLLDNIVIYSPENELGTGLLLLGDGTTSHGYITLCTFGPIQVRGFEYPVKLYAVENVGDGFVNGNHFDSITCAGGKNMLTLQSVGDAQVAGNTIDSIILQTSATTIDGIILIQAILNIFEAAYAFDWVGGLTANAFEADANSYGNHVVRGSLPVVSDSGYRNRICNQSILNERILIVKKEGGDYDKLSDALLAATGNAVGARWTIKVYGRIDDDGQIVVKSYVDVFGFDAVIYDSYGGSTVDVAGITDLWWKNLIIKKTAASGGYEGVISVHGGGADPTVKFEDIEFINEDATQANGRGLSIGAGEPTYIRCRFRGGQGGAGCVGANIVTTGVATFIDCLGEGGSGGNDCDGWSFNNNAYGYLKDCRGKAADNQAWGHCFKFTRGSGAELINCSTELYESGYSFSYDDADNGRFRPYAGHPYQVIGIGVEVINGNPGVTLDIGTAIAGNQVANNVDIGAAGYKVFDFSKEQVVAGAYLYATPSAGINDGDFWIYYIVVKNYFQYGIYHATKGMLHASGGHYLVNGASDALYVDNIPAMTGWQINGSLLETLDPINRSALAMATPQASVPISKCTLIGLHNALSFAPDDGWVEFVANNFKCPASGTDWTYQLEGAHLAASLGAKKCWLPFNFLKEGDEIISYKLVGDGVETNAFTLDCKLVRINKGDPLTTTDVAGGAIAQVNADGVFDSLATLTNPEVVTTDKQYALELLGTTGVADTITVMGAEVKIKRVG